MIINIILLILGFIILIKGADVFVDGASSIAGNFKVSKILIGLTIVSFGTSAPEFAVSVKSLISNNGDIILGNVIGSNILNILLILGISALFHPLRVTNNTVKKELPITLLLTLMFSVLISDTLFNNGINAFTRSDGIVIVITFMVFVYYLFSLMRHKMEEEVQEEEHYLKMSKACFYTIGGIIAIVLGSNFVVDSASYIATTLGISERLIALTVVAIGTSLPELVTSVTATKKGEYDIAIGNVVGSNIFNIGIVAGLPVALLGGINQINFNPYDVLILLISIILLLVFSHKDRKITKPEGLILIAIFIVYYTYVILIGWNITYFLL